MCTLGRTFLLSLHRHATEVGIRGCCQIFPTCAGIGLWIGNSVLDNSLEDESLLCEFVGAPVSEGGVESLVVGPPHIVVEVGA